MNLIMKLSTSQFSKLTMLAIVLVALCFTSCKEDEPLPPSISQLKTCTESAVDNALCSSNVSTFDEDTPKIYISSLFSNIDKNRVILYTLYGEDSNGNWINIFETSTRPSEQGTFDDDVTTFRMNVHFTKPAANDWPKAMYRVDVKIDGDDGATDSIEYEVI